MKSLKRTYPYLCVLAPACLLLLASCRSNPTQSGNPAPTPATSASPPAPSAPSPKMATQKEEPPAKHKPGAEEPRFVRVASISVAGAKKATSALDAVGIQWFMQSAHGYDIEVRPQDRERARQVLRQDSEKRHYFLRLY